MKLLIVDDEPLARQELERLLGRYDDISSLKQAANGKEALEILQQESFDTVFVDIRMPEMDGIELVASAGNKSLFVFCTAYSQHALEAFDLNAFDYLLKPVNPSRLDPGDRQGTFGIGGQVLSRPTRKSGFDRTATRKPWFSPKVWARLPHRAFARCSAF